MSMGTAFAESFEAGSSATDGTNTVTVCDGVHALSLIGDSNLNLGSSRSILVGLTDGSNPGFLVTNGAYSAFFNTTTSSTQFVTTAPNFGLGVNNNINININPDGGVSFTGSTPGIGDQSNAGV